MGVITHPLLIAIFSVTLPTSVSFANVKADSTCAMMTSLSITNTLYFSIYTYTHNLSNTPLPTLLSEMIIIKTIYLIVTVVFMTMKITDIFNFYDTEVN